MLIGQKFLKQLTDHVLKISQAKETEVLVFVADSSLTRFANNQIHQNVASENLLVQVRAIIDKKQGVARVNLPLSASGFFKSGQSLLTSDIKNKLQGVTNKAYEIAKISPPDRHFSHLPGFAEGKFVYPKISSYNEKTTLVTPDQKAKEVEKIIKIARSKKVNAFGSLSVGSEEVVVANSHGVFAYHPLSQGYLNIRIMGQNSSGRSDSPSGYAGETNIDFSKLAIEQATKRAVNKTILGEKQIAIEPGNYEVVLEEPAVAEMMTYMSYLGFGARSYHEERSFMSSQLGKKVMGENV
ncbi:hypothetical protein HY345_01750, partial [Candidatus Microgenomates bacterium]|nr:hypothetical protein [Candidatus Microgenomates bacterium]